VFISHIITLYQLRCACSIVYISFRWNFTFAHEPDMLSIGCNHFYSCRRDDRKTLPLSAGEIDCECMKFKLIYMTNSQSASLSWCQAPTWDLWPIFLSPWNFLQTVACLLFCSAFSDERTGL
jgi:hypothetical protein